MLKLKKNKPFNCVDLLNLLKTQRVINAYRKPQRNRTLQENKPGEKQ